MLNVGEIIRQCSAFSSLWGLAEIIESRWIAEYQTECYTAEGEGNWHIDKYNITSNIPLLFQRQKWGTE